MNIFKEKTNINLNNKNSIVLDIETTGVSRTESSVIIIGIITSEGEFIQFSINNIDKEKELLKKVYPFLNNKHIITYNGQNFDLPFLKERYLFFGLTSFKEESQFDIYRYLISNRLYTNIEKFSLQSIEKYANIDRFENFEFKKDKQLYSDLNNINLSKILIHNKYDVINTEKCLNIVNSIEKEKKINLILNNKKIELYISEIIIDKNTMNIKLKAPKTNMEYHYNNKNYSLLWIENNLEIRTSIVQGYIANNQLGYVHIMKNNQNFIKNRKYNLPKNICIISDGRYFLSNIKNLIIFIIKNFLI